MTRDFENATYVKMHVFVCQLMHGSYLLHNKNPAAHHAVHHIKSKAMSGLTRLREKGRHMDGHTDRYEQTDRRRDN